MSIARIFKCFPLVSSFLPVTSVVRIERVCVALRTITAGNGTWGQLCERDFPEDVGQTQQQRDQQGMSLKHHYTSLVERFVCLDLATNTPSAYLNTAVMLLSDSDAITALSSAIRVLRHGRRPLQYHIDRVFHDCHRRQEYVQFVSQVVACVWTLRRNCTLASCSGSSHEMVSKAMRCIRTLDRLCQYDSELLPGTISHDRTIDTLLRPHRRSRLTFSLFSVKGSHVADMWTGRKHCVAVDGRNPSLAGLSSREFTAGLGELRAALIRALAFPSSPVGHWVLQLRLVRWDLPGRVNTSMQKINFVHLSTGANVGKAERIERAHGASALAFCASLRGGKSRNDTLTRVLADTLTPESHVFLLATIDPAKYPIDETLRTLRYMASASPGQPASALA